MPSRRPGAEARHAPLGARFAELLRLFQLLAQLDHFPLVTGAVGREPQLRDRLGVPIQFVGVGEAVEDLAPFGVTGARVAVRAGHLPHRTNGHEKHPALGTRADACRVRLSRRTPLQHIGRFQRGVAHDWVAPAHRLEGLAGAYVGRSVEIAGIAIVRACARLPFGCDGGPPLAAVKGVPPNHVPELPP